LSEPALQLETGAGPHAAGPVTSRIPSKLLGSLFRSHFGALDTSRRLTVLEIGAALPETVNFFSGFTCRLHFVDLFAEAFVAAQQKQSESELRAAFEACFRFPAGTRLDLCLFWDFLTYLDDTALRAFNAALRPWLHRGTRAHGFGAHHMAVRLANVHYGICDLDTFSLRDRRGPPLHMYPHSQIEMHDMLSCFAFERGLLLPDGKLEMLLKPTL
jgi:hypothetical protein